MVKVSVIVITYNHEKYVSKALDSIINQSTNFNFEILVHDDCSTDKTIDILKQYEKKYPELIKLEIEEENQFSKGNYRVLEHIFQQCKGEYIASCEGDDYWVDMSKLQKQVDFLEANQQYTFITSAAKLVDKDNREIKGCLGNIFDANRDITLENDAIKFYPSAALMLRTSAVGNWPEWYYWCGESGDFVLKLVLMCRGKGWFSKDIYSAYRVMTPGSSNERFSALTKEQRDAYYIERIKTLQEVDKDTNFKAHKGLQCAKLYFEKCRIIAEKSMINRSIAGYKTISSKEYSTVIGLSNKIKFMIECIMPKQYTYLVNKKNEIRNKISVKEIENDK